MKVMMLFSVIQIRPTWPWKSKKKLFLILTANWSFCFYVPNENRWVILASSWSHKTVIRRNPDCCHRGMVKQMTPNIGLAACTPNNDLHLKSVDKSLFIIGTFLLNLPKEIWATYFRTPNVLVIECRIWCKDFCSTNSTFVQYLDF